MSPSPKLDFEAAVSAIQKRLYLTALTVLKNEEDAKDALQETIYIAYLKQHQLKNADAFDGWISKIALRETYRLYRQKKRKWAVETPLTESVFAPNTSDQDLEFFHWISSLDPKDQKILILYFYHNFKLEEIARILQRPLSTVKSRLYRAIQKIQREGEKNL